MTARQYPVMHVSFIIDGSLIGRFHTGLIVIQRLQHSGTLMGSHFNTAPTNNHKAEADVYIMYMLYRHIIESECNSTRGVWVSDK